MGTFLLKNLVIYTRFRLEILRSEFEALKLKFENFLHFLVINIAFNHFHELLHTIGDSKTC